MIDVPPCEACPDCLQTVDIVLESSDGKQFGAHSINLELYTDSFPSVSMITKLDDDVVKLSESADVVLLMLKYMHNQVQPDCDTLEPGLLLDFAKAAEKYGMYPAFEACKKGMRARTSSRPLEALLFKTRYDSTEGIDTLVRQTLSMPMEQVLAVLNNAQDIFIIWSRYREKWRLTFPTYQDLVSRGPTTKNWRSHNSTSGCMRQKLFDTVGVFLKNDRNPSIAEVDRVVATCRETLSCSRCSVVETASDWDEWRARVVESIDKLPKWVEFVSI
ncbi:hypothetical protein D9758_013617 [Tetrapyrgos nigripes]|uniref:BTB domain-containing protein n=1 Tax=Tetrapyrgos nigripes TaxID=182062 RepID=A0A8H5CRP5_9AGAR|nr:hypothetical protein D9758_013617 [Tetrapyrgos nigripes]